MNIIGKVLGLLLGMILAKLPGGIIGLILGHMFDRKVGGAFVEQGGFSRLFTDSASISRQAAFFYSTFSVMGHLAKSTGRVNEAEIAWVSQLMKQMGLTGEHKQEAQDAFREGKLAGFPLDATLVELKRACHNRKQLMVWFLELQVQAALADGQLAFEERELLERMTKKLGLDKLTLQRLITQYKFYTKGHSYQHSHTSGSEKEKASPTRLAQAYATLGCEEGDEQKTVKRAYRKAMSEHHPDKLVAKGLPKEMEQIAKEKAQDIQRCYEMICEANGW